MAATASAPRRDDDPVHPDFDGIAFQATTDKSGIVAYPASGNAQLPPVSFIPVAQAIAQANELSDYIMRRRREDPRSYLAEFLDSMLTDMSAAIEVCRPEPAP